MLMVEIQEIRREVKDSADKLFADICAELDKRKIGGEGFMDTKVILEEMRRSHADLDAKLQEMHDKFAGGTSDIRHGEGGMDVNGDVFELHVDDGDDADEKCMVSVIEKGSLNSYCYWDGKFRRLPKNFTFPSLSLSGLITRWYVRNSVKNIPPYRLLTAVDLETTKLKKAHNHMTKLMKAVEIAAKEVGKWKGLRGNEWNVLEALALFDGIKHFFHYRKADDRVRRHPELRWRTVGELYRKKGYANGFIPTPGTGW